MEDLFEACRLRSARPLTSRRLEGQHYRRVVLQQVGGGRPARSNGNETGSCSAAAPRAANEDAALRSRAPLGINDGKGFVFVSHIGDIQPSGFLPLTAGNVRKDELLEVYRNSLLFRELRNSNLLKGKCGRCGFNTICGGSRARAYAMTGDYLGEEPLWFVSRRWQQRGRLEETEWAIGRKSEIMPSPPAAHHLI
jgi:radical SAM protein with 4Fe4S-binding SPASM domain